MTVDEMRTAIKEEASNYWNGVAMDYIQATEEAGEGSSVELESVLDCAGDHCCGLSDPELRKYWRSLSFEDARALLKEEFTFDSYGM